MNKVFFFSLIFFLAGCSLKYHHISEGLQAGDGCPVELLEQLEKYYSFKKNYNFSELFKLEAPHFRYLNNYEKYLSYQNAYKNNQSQIKAHKCHTTDTNMFLIQLKVLDNISERRYNEIWIKLGSKYYHVLDDKLFFK